MRGARVEAVADDVDGMFVKESGIDARQDLLAEILDRTNIRRVTE
jgi:hypothetical protein